MMLCMARYRRTGFTLIEIMIVIAIIAILAGIAIPNFARARQEAYLEGCKQNLRCIGEAFIMMYERKGDRNTYLWRIGWGDEILEEMVVQGYLTKIPRCPTSYSSDEYFMGILNPEDNVGGGWGMGESFRHEWVVECWYGEHQIPGNPWIPGEYCNPGYSIFRGTYHIASIYHG